MPFDGKSFEHPDEVLDRLRDGRSRVAKGWGQGTGRRGDKYCSVGAVMEYGADPSIAVAGTTKAALECLYEALPVVRPAAWLTPAENIIRYNDYPDRTQEDIISLFDKAIEARERALLEASPRMSEGVR